MNFGYVLNMIEMWSYQRMLKIALTKHVSKKEVLRKIEMTKKLTYNHK